MPEQSPKVDPCVAILEDALAHIVVAERLLRRASLPEEDGPLGERAARRAYRHILDALDRSESLGLVLRGLASELERKTDLGLPVR